MDIEGSVAEIVDAGSDWITDSGEVLAIARYYGGERDYLVFDELEAFGMWANSLRAQGPHAPHRAAPPDPTFITQESNQHPLRCGSQPNQDRTDPTHPTAPSNGTSPEPNTARCAAIQTAR